MAVPGQSSEAECVISPCVGICRMSDDGVYCIGCMRTLPEIAAWAGADPAYKQAVWRALPARRAKFKGEAG